ncbi:hypothetical protein JYU34_021634 [Plutella xylostella]|uniref:Reverse transcriptase n=1 Tax=Plutella xylostella TaxID=51655 RepID=A0ABQ7PR44_PLUXY|nr:hypothetical protein JYU34_021634 [Plutella xylostella]
MAIKKFADGLRNRRLSTIIAARNFSSLKDAIQAAIDEEVTSSPSTSGTIFGINRPKNSNYRGRGNNTRGYNKFNNNMFSQGQSRTFTGRYYQNNNFRGNNRGYNGSGRRGGYRGGRSFHGPPRGQGQGQYRVNFALNNSCYPWLVDTGASISAIKHKHLLEHNIPFHKESISIKGIGGCIETIGKVCLYLTSKGETFKHQFYVFDSLPCKASGILGHDFLNNFKSVLDLEQNTLSLWSVNNKHITLPMYNGNSNACFIIPARSESIHSVDTYIKEDSVVYSSEIQNGVFIASTIVKPIQGKIPIKILNTTEQDVVLYKIDPIFDSLNNYKICMFHKNEKNADRVKELFSFLQLSHLNLEEQISIENLCAKYSDVFHLPKDKLTTTNLYSQSINLKPNSTPVFVKPYRLPHSQKNEINQQIKQMLNDGIIEPATSEWSSPILLVPKKGGNNGNKKWRLVIDYRKLNERIEDDKFPLPNITEILDSLSGAVYYSHLDLFSGYYQVNLSEESRKLTAFCSGQFQMKRLPMGLKTSPSAFSRMITLAMSGLTYKKCFVYLDDLIVFGRNLDDHNKNLLDVFERLRQVNLKLNPSKCDFLKKEILYLGHVVTGDGILPDPDKVKIMKEYPIPKNVEEVKRFIAFANYYRKFIPNFSDKVYSLNKLCKKNVPFKWDEQCQKDFELVKQSLLSPPVLQYPNFDESNEFRLQTDASGYALGTSRLF